MYHQFEQVEFYFWSRDSYEMQLRKAIANMKNEQIAREVIDINIHHWKKCTLSSIREAITLMKKLKKKHLDNTTKRTTQALNLQRRAHQRQCKLRLSPARSTDSLLRMAVRSLFGGHGEMLYPL